MPKPKAYDPQEGYRFQILTRDLALGKEWEHLSYAEDRAELKSQLEGYRLAHHQSSLELKTIPLPAKYWPKPPARIDQERRLYRRIAQPGGGFGSLGFDYVARMSNAVAAWLKLPPSNFVAGTIEAYNEYLQFMATGQTYSEQTGNRCNAELIPELVGLERYRVEVSVPLLGEPPLPTGGPSRAVHRFIVGKSTGWMPCHLEIHNRRSTGGSPVYWPPGTTLNKVIGRISR